uniref:Uncharacterized protein n=1 Tax=Magnetospirillum gryphiswaldense TaxID=55518 RepID=A4TTX8_9PROT|nr:conserved hypothetical protein, secreted [Magnetospirillum gryphiswaldense MSR-1]
MPHSSLLVPLCWLPCPPLAADRLQVPQLNHWKGKSPETDKTRQADGLIPGQKGAETWTRRITVQAFRGVPLTVSEFLEQAVAKTAPVCEAAAAGPASMGSIGGREAGSRTIACGKYKGDGRGTYVLHFAIRGRDAFYVVSRMWRGAPFALGQVPVPESELVQWRAYADAIDLCDTTDARRPCRD